MSGDEGRGVGEPSGQCGPHLVPGEQEDVAPRCQHAAGDEPVADGGWLVRALLRLEGEARRDEDRVPLNLSIGLLASLIIPVIWPL